MVQSSWTIDMIIQVTTMFESCHKKSSIWMQVMVWNNIRLCKYAPPSSNEGIPNDYWCHIDLPLTCTLLPGKALNICRLFLVNPKNSFWAAHTSTCTCKRYNCVYKAWGKTASVAGVPSQKPKEQQRSVLRPAVLQAPPSKSHLESSE